MLLGFKQDILVGVRGFHFMPSCRTKIPSPSTHLLILLICFWLKMSFATLNATRTSVEIWLKIQTLDKLPGFRIWYLSAGMHSSQDDRAFLFNVFICPLLEHLTHSGTTRPSTFSTTGGEYCSAPPSRRPPPPATNRRFPTHYDYASWKTFNDTGLMSPSVPRWVCFLV